MARVPFRCRPIKTAISNWGAMSPGLTAPCHRYALLSPRRPLNLRAKSWISSWGYVVEIGWGNRGSAADDIEDLAGWLFCRRADRDFVCRDASALGIGAERRNTERKSG